MVKRTHKKDPRRADGHKPNSVDRSMNEILGKALAGHAARCGDRNNPKLAAKAGQYDNPLTDWITLLIAEEKARINEQNKI